MTTNWLIVIYALGFLASFYLGMRIEDRRWRKQASRMRLHAYDRGFNAGRNFNDHIRDARDELTSSVRILSGEGADSDRPFPRS